MDHKNYLSNNMTLNQLMKITGSVSLVTMLALTQRGVLQAEETTTPTTNRVNLEPISVNYNDTDAIAKIAKTILKDHVNLLSEFKMVESSQYKTVYSLEDYIVSVYYEANSGLGVKDVKLTIETKFTHDRPDDQKIIALNDQSNAEVIDGTVNVYNVKINVIDTVAPVISLSESSVTIDDTDSFDINNYISVSDNVDGVLGYTVDGALETTDDKYKAGTYTFTVSAVDSSGNTASSQMSVTVNKTEPVVVNTSNLYYGSNPDRSNYAGASVLVDAAYAQLGRRQDCTMLVTNALAAAGINYHGWPAGYFSLGYTVSGSEAQPGDLIYYDNAGAGVPHIALYIGNGRAIHGGWQGSTKIAPAYVGSGPVFIRVTKG